MNPLTAEAKDRCASFIYNLLNIFLDNPQREGLTRGSMGRCVHREWQLGPVPIGTIYTSHNGPKRAATETEFGC